MYVYTTRYANIENVNYVAHVVVKRERERKKGAKILKCFANRFLS